jgi:DNA repair exonuclease SbcCD nuclease subunit
MPRFLHVADVHLGYTKYDTPERTKDFFLAFRDALERYAIEPQVDFVLIVGDLFEHRQVLPAILNQAQLCLDELQEAGIPVLAIEGNHDYRLYGTSTSWLRYLADWGRLILLEPNAEEVLDLWNSETRQGGYIDLACGVRVIGSRWYGAAAPQAILGLADQIAQLPPGPEQTVMMFHHGLEGHVSRYSGALRYQDFAPLLTAGVDYLALGHIHRSYTAESWIFNPGSVEANSVLENQAQNPRGVFLVNLTPKGIQADLKSDYYQRPIVRLTLKAVPQQTAAELEAAAIATLQTAADQGQTQDAIVELRIQGTIGFERSDLNVRELRSHLHTLSKALVMLIKYEVTGVEYHSYLSDQEELPSRHEIERLVFTDLLAAHTHYRDRAEALSLGLMDLKDRLLKHQTESDLYQFAQDLLSTKPDDVNPQESYTSGN